MYLLSGNTPVLETGASILEQASSLTMFPSLGILFCHIAYLHISPLQAPLLCERGCLFSQRVQALQQ
jgi:hypothetical protein